MLGGDGNDTLIGGTGVNTLNGGAGRDAASYAQAAAAVRVDLGMSSPQVTGGGGTDTLVDIEDLVGSSFDDTLIGNAAANRLFGGAGNDVLIGFTGDILDGGAGNDTASYATATVGVTVDLAISGAQSTGRHADQYRESDRVSRIADTLKGDSGANRLIGGGGSDTLMGRAGDDILDGGDGFDTASYADASAGVTVDLAIAGPQSTGEGADTLISIENLTGSAFADTLRGTSGDNVLIGGAGDDTLAGLGGQRPARRRRWHRHRFLCGRGGGCARRSQCHRLSIHRRRFRSAHQHRERHRLGLCRHAHRQCRRQCAQRRRGQRPAHRRSRPRHAHRWRRSRRVRLQCAQRERGRAGNRDVITDFQSGLDDIDLTGIDANTGRSGDQGFRFIGTQEFRGREGELRYQTFDQAGTANDITVVSGDINGDRIADFEIEIVGIVQLSSGDFLL